VAAFYGTTAELNSCLNGQQNPKIFTSFLKESLLVGPVSVALG
jgi:hypothetical protein